MKPHPIPPDLMLPVQQTQHVADLVRETEHRRKAEAALVRNEAEYKSVVEVLSEGIAVIEADGTISVVNGSAAALVELPKEALLGARLLDLRWHAVARDGARLPHAEHPALRTLRTGEPVAEFVMGIVLRDRSIRWLSVNTHPLRRGTAGAVDAVVASFTDVTERLNREREMRESHAALDQLTREFIGIVSHELRTPLTAIRGALGLLDGPAFAALPQKAQSLIGLARANTDRLTRIIENMLDLEHIESGELELMVAPVGAAAVVGRATEPLRDEAARRRVELAVDVAPGTRVLADEARLAQALGNIVSNAIKFSPDGATVEIRAKEDGADGVCFEVLDHGPGLPEEMIARLFKRFVQADASDRRRPGGAGLGLAISHALVTRMSGRIGVEAAAGRPTRFWIELPGA